MDRIIGTYRVNGHTIEYSITGTNGEPVLVFHGGHSNAHEEFGYAPLVKHDFKIITPSRAGYGKTSKDIGKSLSIACEYYEELLNHLRIDKVHLLAISAGGPSGIYFAAHYPNRVKTLTLQSAVTTEWHTSQDTIYKLAQILFHPFLEKMIWKLTSMMSNCFPTFMFKQMAPSFSKLPFAQIQQKMNNNDIEEVRKMNNRQNAGHGFLIDLQQTKDITPQYLNRITCPTLVMHSKFDQAVSLEHPNHAHKQIPNSELCLLDSWGHLIWLGQESQTVNRELIDFLTTYSKTS